MKRMVEPNQCANPNLGIGMNGGAVIGRALPVHEAEKNAHYHRAEAQKHDRVAAFLRENPAFGEFIQLLRDGAIRL